MEEKYLFFNNLMTEADPPQNGILSRTLQNDERSKVVVFGFAAGQELSAHTAPMPALLYFLEGTAQLTLGTDVMTAEAGAFAYMTTGLRHAIMAKTPVKMLLVLLKT